MVPPFCFNKLPVISNAVRNLVDNGEDFSIPQKKRAFEMTKKQYSFS